MKYLSKILMAACLLCAHGAWAGSVREEGVHDSDAYEALRPVPRPRPIPRPVPRPIPRPVPRPIPVPVPRPIPIPVPVPVPVQYQCYAQTMDGRSQWSGIASVNYNAAVDSAISTCQQYSGQSCMITRCDQY